MLNEIKVKIKVDTADGQKEISELYIVKADSVADAEVITCNELSSFDFEVAHAKQTKYSEVIGEGEFFYSVKALFAEIDEKTGKEKYTSGQILVAENDFDHAKNTADKHLSSFMSYVETVEIKKTKIKDYYEKV